MHVKLTQFEGPLETLGELIEANKLDITEIALGQVTDQYLEIVAARDIPPDQLADFLLIASRLLLIKSKTLLPFMALSQEEEAEIRELRFSLEEYRRYREQMKRIRELVARHARLAGRSLWQGRAAYFLPPDGVTGERIRGIFRDLLDRWERVVAPLQERRMDKVVSMEEKIKSILERIQVSAATSLTKLAGNAAAKTEVILCFLALLFLFRQKVVELEQHGYGDDIMVKTRTAA
jgi:segregation and condensation protein A